MASSGRGARKGRGRATAVYPPVSVATREQRSEFFPFGIRSVNSTALVATEDEDDALVPLPAKKRHGRMRGAQDAVLVLDGSDDDEVGDAKDLPFSVEGDDSLLLPSSGGAGRDSGIPLLAQGGSSSSKAALSNGRLTRRYMQARRARTADKAAAIILGDDAAPLACCCGRMSRLCCAATTFFVLAALLGGAYAVLRFVAGPALAQHTADVVFARATATSLELGAAPASAAAPGADTDAESPSLGLGIRAEPWAEWWSDPLPELKAPRGVRLYLLSDDASCPAGGAAASAPGPASAAAPRHRLGTASTAPIAVGSGAAAPAPVAASLTRPASAPGAAPSADAANSTATALLAAAALGRRVVCVAASFPGATVTVSILPGLTSFLRHTYPVSLSASLRLDTGADSVFGSAGSAGAPTSELVSFRVIRPPRRVSAALPNASAWLQIGVTVSSAKRVSVADLGPLRLAVVVNGSLDSAWMEAAAAAEDDGSPEAAAAAPLLPLPGHGEPVTWRLEGPLFASDAAATSALLDELSDDESPVRFVLVGQAGTTTPEAPAAPNTTGAAATPAIPRSASRFPGGGLYGAALAAAPVGVVVPRRVAPMVEGLAIESLDIAAAGASVGSAYGPAAPPGSALVNVSLSFVVRNPVAAFVEVVAAAVSLDVDVRTSAGDVLGALRMVDAPAVPLPALPSVNGSILGAAAALTAFPCQAPGGTWGSAGSAGGSFACVRFGVTGMTVVDVSSDGGSAWGRYLSSVVTGHQGVPLVLASRANTTGAGGIGHGGIVVRTTGSLGDDVIEAPVAAVAANVTPAGGFAALGPASLRFDRLPAGPAGPASLRLTVSQPLSNPSTAAFDLGPAARATLLSAGRPVAALATPRGTNTLVPRGPSTLVLEAGLPAAATVDPALAALLSDFAFGRTTPSVAINGTGADAANGTAAVSWLDDEVASLWLDSAAAPAAAPATPASAAVTALYVDVADADDEVTFGATLTLSGVALPLPLPDLRVPSVSRVALRLTADGTASLTAASLPASFAPAAAFASAQPGVVGDVVVTVPAGTPLGRASSPTSGLTALVSSLLLRGDGSPVGSAATGSLDLAASTDLLPGLVLAGMPVTAAPLTACGVGLGAAGATLEVGSVSFADAGSDSADGAVTMAVGLTVTPARGSCPTVVSAPTLGFDVDVGGSSAVTVSTPRVSLRAGTAVSTTASGTITPAASSGNAALGAIVSAALQGRPTAVTLSGALPAGANGAIGPALAALSFPATLPAPPGSAGASLLRGASLGLAPFVTGESASAAPAAVTLTNPLGVGICVSAASVTVTLPVPGAPGGRVTLFTAALSDAFLGPGESADVPAVAALPLGPAGSVDELVAASAMAVFYAGAFNASDPSRPLPSATTAAASATGTATIAMAGSAAGCGAGVSVGASLGSASLRTTLTRPAAGSAAASPLVVRGVARRADVDLSNRFKWVTLGISSPSLGASLGVDVAWSRPTESAVTVESVDVDVLLLAPTSRAEYMANWMPSASGDGASLSGATLSLVLPPTFLAAPWEAQSALKPLAAAALSSDPEADAASLAGTASLTLTVGGVRVVVPNVPLTGRLLLPGIGFSGAPSPAAWPVDSYVLGDVTSDGASLAAAGGLRVRNPTDMTVTLPAPLVLAATIVDARGKTVADAGNVSLVSANPVAPRLLPAPGAYLPLRFLAGATTAVAFEASVPAEPASLGPLLSNRLSFGSDEPLRLALRGSAASTWDSVVSGAASLIAASMTVPPAFFNATSAEPQGGVAPLFANLSIDCAGYIDDAGTTTLEMSLYNPFNGSTGKTLVDVADVDVTMVLCPARCGGDGATAACCLGTGTRPPASAELAEPAFPSGSRLLSRTKGGEQFASLSAKEQALPARRRGEGGSTSSQTVTVPKDVSVGADVMAAVSAGVGSVGRAAVTGTVTLTVRPAGAEGVRSVSVPVTVTSAGVPLVATGFPHGGGGGGGGGKPAPAPPVDPAVAKKYVDAFAAQGRKEFKDSQWHGYYDGDVGLAWDAASGAWPGKADGMGLVPALLFYHSDPSRTLQGQLLPDDVTFTNHVPKGSATVPASRATAGVEVWTGIGGFAASVSAAASAQLGGAPSPRLGQLTATSMAAVKKTRFDGADTLGQATLELRAYSLDARAGVTGGKIMAHPMWLASLTAMPNTYSSADDKQSWSSFLAQWGTHFTAATETGAAMWCWAAFDYGLLQTGNDFGASFTAAQAEAAVRDFCVRDTGLSTSGTWAGKPAASSRQSVFEAHVTGSGPSVLGGDPAKWQPGVEASIEAWLESVTVAPNLVRASLLPADVLASLYAPGKATALKAAIAASLRAAEEDWAPGRVPTCPDACTHGACSGGADACSCADHQFGRLCQTCATGWIGSACQSPDCRKQGGCNAGGGGGTCTAPNTCKCNSCWAGPECATYTCGCLGANATVTARGRGDVRAADLRVGDAVRSLSSSTGRAVWSDVFHVAKPSEEASANASLVDVRVAGSPAEPLRLTAEHLIYVVPPSAIGPADSALLRSNGSVACGGRSAADAKCPGVAEARPVPAALLRPGDVVLTLGHGPGEGASPGLARVTGVTPAVASGVVTVHTLDGPVLASGVVASSYECDEGHGWWDTVDLRAAYVAAPWLASDPWVRDAVAWADASVYGGAPVLARAFGAALPGAERAVLGGADAWADSSPTGGGGATSAGEAAAQSAPAPAGGALPAPHCPDGTRGRAVLG